MAMVMGGFYDERHGIYQRKIPPDSPGAGRADGEVCARNPRRSNRGFPPQGIHRQGERRLCGAARRSGGMGGSRGGTAVHGGIAHGRPGPQRMLGGRRRLAATWPKEQRWLTWLAVKSGWPIWERRGGMS